MRTQNSLGTRLLALMLAVVLVLGMLPTHAVAAPFSGSRMEILTPGGTSKGKEAVFDGLELNWVEANPSIGRVAGWWVGIKAIAPKGMDLSNAAYQIGDTVKSFQDFKDSKDGDAEQYIELWGLVNEQILRDANTSDGKVSYEWKFDWAGDGEFEDSFQISVVSASTVLKDADGSIAFPKAVDEGAVTVLSAGGRADGSDVRFEDLTLNWVEANPSIGRVAGWWVGIKVTAPEGADVENARYTSGGVAKSFYQNKDSISEPHYIELWGLVNQEYLDAAKQTDGEVNYEWTFDWNYDGLFEQKVTITVDAASVKLLDQNGAQVYPKLGAVSSYSGGRVVGSTTSEVEVTIEETTVYYSPADEAIGRTAGWWVGIKVEAPEGLSEEILRDASYKIKNGPNAQWGEAKSFFAYKDSVAAPHYIQLWFPVSPESIEKFRSENRNITMWYTFDWDNDGAFEQNVTFSVVPSEKIELLPGTYPLIFQVSGSNTHTDFVQYSVGGTYDFKGKLDGVDENVRFWILSNGELVTETEYAAIDANGMVTLKKPGQVTLQAVRAGDAYYQEATATCTLEITKAEQVIEVKTPVDLVYREEAYSLSDIFSVTGSMVGGSAVYSIDEAYSQFAQITGNELKLRKAGTFVVQAYQPGNAFYADSAIVEITVNVAPAQQDALKLLVDGSEKSELTYEDVSHPHALSVEGGSGTGLVSYEIIASESLEGEELKQSAVAAISGNGLSVRRSGQVTVKVTKGADECYEAITQEFTIRINRGTKAFGTSASVVEVPYGTRKYEASTNLPEDLRGMELTYAIGDINEIGASINAKTGSVTFVASKAQTGEVKIVVTREQNEKYEAFSCEFTLKVVYDPSLEQVKALVEGEHFNNEWFTGDVKLIAPEGYELNVISDAIESQDYTAFTTYTQEGEYVVKYCLRNEVTQVISAVKTVGFKIDKTMPSELEVTYEKPSLLERLFDEEYDFFGGTVKAIFSAKDEVSGISKILCSLDGEETYVEVELDNDGVYSMPIEPEYRDYVRFKAVDAAGWEISNLDDETVVEKVLVVDAIAPELAITRSNNAEDIGEEAVIYTNDSEFALALRVTDNNYEIESQVPTVTLKYNGEETIRELTWSKNEPKAESVDQYFYGTATLGLKTGETLEEGEYEVTLSFTDSCGNDAVTKTVKVIVDYTNPDVSLEYAGESSESGHYAQNREAVLVVEEAHFLANSETLAIDVTAVDAEGNPVDITDYAEAVAGGIWSEEDGKFRMSLPAFDQEVTYTVKIAYTDPAGNEGLFEDSFTIDLTPAVVNVTFSSEDEPSAEMFYQGNCTVKLSVEEANFDPAQFEVEIQASNLKGEVLFGEQTAAEYYNALIREPSNWMEEDGKHVLELPFEQDASYTFNFTYTELSGRLADKYLLLAEDNTPAFDGMSFVRDTVAAEFQGMECDDASVLEKIIEAVTFGFFRADPVVTFTFTDDTSGVDHLNVTYNGSVDGATFELENVEPTHVDGEVFQIEVKLANAEQIDQQLRGTLVAEAEDKAGNVSDVTGNGTILVRDTVSPEVSVSFAGGAEGVMPIFRNINNHQVESFAEAAVAYYSGKVDATVSVTEANFFEGLVGGKENDEVIHEVTIHANRADGNGYGNAEAFEYLPKGARQHVAGVDTKEIVWARIEGTDEYRSSGISFEADGRYTLMMLYPDFSGNEANIDSQDGAKNVQSYTSKPVVVDSVAPVVSVDYYVGNKKTDEVNGKSFQSLAAVITVKEHNFDPAYFQLEVDAENLRLPNEELFDYAAYAKDPKNWVHSGETHTLNLPAFETEAAYQVKAICTDLAGHDGKAEARNFIIDSTAPTVSVSFDEKVPVKGTYEDRKYFDANQTATIVVDEHNFTAAGVDVMVTAVNAAGAAISVTDFAAFAKNDKNWKHDGDLHTLVLSFNTDANYTFDIKVRDTADNSYDAYTPDKFTVDKKAPEKLEISYKTDYETKDGNKYYYNNRVEVTIVAYDEISAMKELCYSYTTNPNVSGVNAGLSNQVIELTPAGDCTVTAKFYIPKEALNSRNQFNGTVSFTATDWAMHTTEREDSTTIIVDNISPVGSVSFNAPIKEENGTSYYDGSIQGTISITEANFDKNDVEVTVTRDGATYPVQVSWSDNSVDKHTGSFTLAEDGDYIVTVSYKDKSLNAMTTYTSGKMTVDTVDPVVKVSGVQHESANNDETISVTVEVSDRNISLDDFKPTLTAVVKKDNGDDSYTLESIEIPLGQPVVTTGENGDTVYRYTVDNLETDGYYTLVCEAVDNAGRTVKTLIFENADGTTTTVDAMNFSVNRTGSVFWITTEHNDKYTGETFTNELDGGYVNDQVQIVIHESNVDRVDIDPESATVLTLNDGVNAMTIELDDKADGSGNYDKNVNVGTGGWYENVYTLDNEVFDHDGVYSVNIITYDKADNSNINTKYDKGIIHFTVDRTNPVISANVKSGQRVDANAYTVEFMVTDANLDAQSIEVVLNGETVQVQELGSNQFSFDVKDGLNQHFEINAKDLAGNEAELFKVERFTVSEHWWVLWYANPLLFWGSIITAAAAAVGIFLFFFAKKKKKDEQDQPASVK